MACSTSSSGFRSSSQRRWRRYCPNQYLLLVDFGAFDGLSVEQPASGYQAIGSKQVERAVEQQLPKGNTSQFAIVPVLFISRTDVVPSAISRLFSASQSLKIACALHSPALEQDATSVSNNNHKGKLLKLLVLKVSRSLVRMAAGPQCLGRCCLKIP